MKNNKLWVGLIVSILCVTVLSGCGNSKGSSNNGVVGDKLIIYSSDHSEDYLSAAKKYFNADSKESSDPVNDSLEGIGGDVGYVAIISDDESVLDHEQIEGRRYTVNVFDDGRSNLKVCIRYSVGTTDNCVTKGNLESGETSLNNSFEIKADGITDYKQRADFIFKNVSEQIKKVGQ